LTFFKIFFWFLAAVGFRATEREAAWSSGGESDNYDEDDDKRRLLTP